MTDEPISNPNPPAPDPQPVNGHAEPPHEVAAEPLAGNAGRVAAAAAKPTLTLGADDMKSYLMLRQSIDLFTATALAFYATGRDVKERLERAENVQFVADDFKEGVMPDGCGANERRAADGTCVPKDALFLGDRLIILPQ